MVSVSYQSSSKHCVGESNYHFQFTSKYRRDIFRDGVLKNACRVSFKEIAARHGVVLLAVEFGSEHVHLFMGNCRRVSVSQLAQYFKGASSRDLRMSHWERVRKKECGGALWSAGYFYESIGWVTSETIEYYIERQQGKHWAEMDYDARMRLKMGQSKLQDFSN